MRWKGQLVAAAGIGALLLTGCGTTSSGTGSPSQPATVGQALDMNVVQGNKPVSVTVTKLVDPATAATPAPGGDRYVGVDFDISNPNSTVLVVSPLTSTVVTDSNGQSYRTVTVPLTDCPTFGTGWVAQIAPGDLATGCVTVEVPSGATLAQVVEGANGKTPAEWNITGGGT